VITISRVQTEEYVITYYLAVILEVVRLFFYEIEEQLLYFVISKQNLVINIWHLSFAVIFISIYLIE